MCLVSYNEIYKDLSAESKQSKITDFLQKVEYRTQDAAAESSEDEDFSPERKRPRLMVLSNNDEKNIIISNM